MTSLILLALVAIFCAANLLLGVCAAGFFGRGPLRHSAIVRFLSDPIIEPPQFLVSKLPLFRRTHAAPAADSDDDQSPAS